MATVEELPIEVLAYILSFLDGEDIARTSCTCHCFREATKIQSIWQRRCREEFGIDTISSTNDVTFFELYSKLLYKYGKILGVWQPDVGPYGGLVVVKVEQNVFSCKCDEPDLHRHPNGQEAGFSEWLSTETDNNLQNFLFHGQELLLMKYLITSQFSTSSTYVRLELPKPSPDIFEIIPPGIFKGTYGTHGIELMMLSYEESHSSVHIRKISGDPNVPAGELSIKADISRPMVLTVEQQNSIKDLTDIDTPDIPDEVTLDKLPQQPFRIPADCFDRDTNPPRDCRARFYSQGQIAGHGFSEPSFIPGHFIVFDDDTFGHIWMKLGSFSIYSRVKENII